MTRTHHAERRRAAPIAGLVAISLAAIVLRAIDLDRQELWFDEAFAGLMAMQPFASIVGEMSRDSSPPLYYVLLHSWAEIVGFDPWSLRLFSAVSGVLGVWLTMVLGARVWNARVGIIAGALLAVSPLHLYYSREARPYALFIVFTLLSLLALERLTRRHRVPDALLYAVATLAAMYTHNYGLFVAAALAVPLLARRVPARTAALAAGALAIGYVPWVPVLLQQVRSGATGWLRPLWDATPPLFAIPRTLAAFSIGGANPDYVATGSDRLSAGVHWLAYAIFALLVVRAIAPAEDKAARRIAVTTAVLIGVPYALSFMSPIYLVGRHDVVALPLFFLLAARGLTTLQPRRAVALALVVAALAAGSLIVYWQVSPADAGRRQAALLLDHAGHRDAIVATGFTRNTVEYYVRRGGGAQRFSSFPLSFNTHRGWLDEREISNGALLRRDAEMLTTRLTSELDGHSRLWIVHSRQLASANDILMHAVEQVFQQIPCPADAERAGLTCWKARGARRPVTVAGARPDLSLTSAAQPAESYAGGARPWLDDISSPPSSFSP